MNEYKLRGVVYLILTERFPPYKVSRARNWLKNYRPEGYRLFRLPNRDEPIEFIEIDAADDCEADIGRKDPNVIDLEAVYARILKTNGPETAELFKADLLAFREKKK